MNRRICCLLLASLTFVGGFHAAAKPKLTVLAAISLKDVMADLERDFEASHDVDVEFVFGASGQLAAQIESGAPADVFVSAADAQVGALAQHGRVVPESRTLVAHNELVLVVPATAKDAITRFEDLGSDRVKRLACGEPKSVPAGMYARQVLSRLQLESAVAEKLVLGANVRQVLDYVARGEADAGIVYRTDARASKDVRIVAEAEQSWHEPINYPAVVVKGSDEQQLAAEFIAAMKSEAGRAALTKQGFSLPTTAPTSRPTR